MKLKRMLSVFSLAALFAAASVSFAAGNAAHTSAKFEGAKANTGTVTHTVENGKSILRVSADFKVPDTPAPTWRVNVPPMALRSATVCTRAGRRSTLSSVVPVSTPTLSLVSPESSRLTVA